MVASSRGYTAILNTFLSAGADVNAAVKTEDPGTPGGGGGIPNERVPPLPPACHARLAAYY